MINRIVTLKKFDEILKSSSELEGFLSGYAIILNNVKTWVLTGVQEMPDGAIGRWNASGNPDMRISINMIKDKKTNQWEVLLNGNEVKVPDEIVSVDLEGQYQDRLRVPGFSGLDQYSVLIVGVGSVGSRIAVDLARAGIGKLILIDPETVDVRNLCRCEFFADQIGQQKVFAVRDTIYRINPSVQVECIVGNILDFSPEKIETLLSSADIVFHATDNIPAVYTLNRIAFSKLPVIYTGLYHNAFSGFVIYTLPGLTPCYECIMPAPGDMLNEYPEAEVRETPSWDYTDNTGRTRAIPGLGVDCSRASTIASRIGISLLCRGNENSNFPLHNNKNVVFACNVPEENIYSYPFQTEWAKTSPREECWCQKSEPTDDEILSVERIIETIPIEDGIE